MQLTPSMEKFIVHWGEMGSRWGVNRTVAQIFALLVLSKDPMNAEQIVETLGVARSNASNSLKELQSLNLVSLNHKLGDRRDHFVAIKDCWDMLQILAEERKKREIDPTLEILEQCLAEAKKDNQTPEYVSEQLQQMSDFMQTMSKWYQQMKQMDRKLLVKFFKVGSLLTSWLSKK
ncbi:GbsR/MarR family transcriptional regulator [Colwellia sp. RSH04]|uniref:GbsR/MarR family transcriptional regulator n=1 Tax=Colwellia sp. RSH04 TaxID=2305464 RepID=UPI000E589F6F|nr:MarR family transcriptional regulator [Colwellia sp. RSH04]RHW74973.1 MarR family transcriptional regulator [Colwellia sp. RSH04]